MPDIASSYRTPISANKQYEGIASLGVIEATTLGSDFTAQITVNGVTSAVISWTTDFETTVNLIQSTIQGLSSVSACTINRRDVGGVKSKRVAWGIFPANITEPPTISFSASTNYLKEIPNTFTSFKKPSGVMVVTNDPDQMNPLEIDDAGSGITYIGYAAPGSALADPVWAIKRVDESASPDISTKWAEGNKSFLHVWNNRATLTYA